jgi:hypothetical protein
MLRENTLRPAVESRRSQAVETRALRREVTYLLEKHIGDGENTLHRGEAIAARRRIRHTENNSVARVLAGLAIAANGPLCAVVREAVANLRGVHDQLFSEHL